MKKRCLPAAALLLSATPSAFATDIDPIIVTATRTAQTADETLSSVTVITRKEIERQQAQSVQDLLRGIPGVSIANNGGPGKATSVFLRGTESDHVLVLIDGIKVGSATLGTTAFQDIPVEQFERIEIVRGPRSSLYGSEAIGGVIQIFTRKGGGALKPFSQALFQYWRGELPDLQRLGWCFRWRRAWLVQSERKRHRHTRVQRLQRQALAGRRRLLHHRAGQGRLPQSVGIPARGLPLRRRSRDGRPCAARRRQE